jgi:uncharacterized DUF497 family protein
MDRHYEHRGTHFVWHDAKAELNVQKHGVAFEEAVTVFDDPLLCCRPQVATMKDETRRSVSVRPAGY